MESSKDETVFMDIIKGLHQKSLFPVLDNIFEGQLRDDTTSLFRASQVSTSWRSILLDWLRKAFQRRVDTDPLSSMIYRRWQSLRSSEVAEALDNGDYMTLHRRLMEERLRLATNRRDKKCRTRKINLRPYHQANAPFFVFKNDHRLAVVVQLRADQLHFLIFDPWTTALKQRLVRPAGRLRTVRWNDRFMAALTDTELTVWDLENSDGQLVLVMDRDSPLLDHKTPGQFEFSDLFLNCDDVLVVTLKSVKDSKLFVCRLLVPDGEEPKIHVLDFPAVSLVSLFDLDRNFMILQLRDGNQNIKPTDLLRVQVRSVHAFLDLIAEREKVNLFLRARIFDRSWLLVSGKSAKFEIWNFRTGVSHELVMPISDRGLKGHLHYVDYRTEIVGKFDDGKDERKKLRLNELLLLPANLCDVRLAPNPTSCVWWRDYLSIYLSCNVQLRSPVLEISDYFD